MISKAAAALVLFASNLEEIEQLIVENPCAKKFVQIDKVNQVTLTEPLVVGGVKKTHANGSVLCWLFVPRYNDSVLVNLWQGKRGELLKNGCIEPGIISYVSPVLYDSKKTGLKHPVSLPPGLFFWKSDAQGDLRSVKDTDLLIFRRASAKNKQNKGQTPYMWNANVGAYCKQGSTETFKPKKDDSPHPNDDAVKYWIYNIVCDRDLAFEYVIGMYEDAFRKIMWPSGVQDASASRKRWAGLKNEKDFQGGYRLPNRRQIKYVDSCINGFASHTVHDLRLRSLKILRDLHDKKNPKNGRLYVLRRSKLGADNEYLADIRWLQPNWPGAVFQLASTFGSIEGGMSSGDANLDEMNDHPVQGENATICTMPAAIVRRYFVSQDDRNLLKKLEKWFVVGVDGNQGFTIKKLTGILGNSIGKIWKSAHAERAIAGYVRVGVHKNVPVTTGVKTGVQGEFSTIEIPRSKPPFTVPQDQKSTRRAKPAFDARFSEKEVAYIHQIFTSAADLNPSHEGAGAPVLVDEESALAKALLYAAYEGTILAALDVLQDPLKKSDVGHNADVRNYFNKADLFNQTKKSRPTLFLTFVGGSAFRNPLEWVYNILKALKDLIILSGLEIVLVSWDDMVDKKDTASVTAIENIELLAAEINTTSAKGMEDAAKNYFSQWGLTPVEKAGEASAIVNINGEELALVEKD